MGRTGADVKEIFIEALDRAVGPDRVAYLDDACAGDVELRQRVEALLRAHDQASEVFGPASSPESGATLDPAPSPFGETLAVVNSNGDGLAPGSTVRYFGDYEIRQELGRGGMGVVYQARQVSLNRSVALKMLRAGLLAGVDELRRFQNEAEAVALLDHPGIVPVYEVGEHEGQRYLSMKLVLGGNLAGRPGAFRDDPRAAAKLMAEVAEAVHHAHMRGILHRDLKPANILVDTNGRPQVTDFGLAKRVEADAELTLSGAILGTPEYMAPEQAAGRRGSITTATDVHGLGAVLYALLTGKAPFVGDGVMDTLQKVRDEAPEPPRKSNPKLPGDLQVICLKCLEKDPRRRYTSAQAVADDLRAWLGSRPIAARPVGPIERAALFLRRKPVLATAYALTAAVVLLLGFGGTVVRLWKAAETARAEAVLARNDVEKTKEKLAAVEYGRTIQVAYQEWRDNNVAGAIALLEGTRHDLRGWEWRYLHRLCHSNLLTLDGQTFVQSASFSPDGSRIVTGSWDWTTKVWNAISGEDIFTLKGHSGEVASVSFSPDGSRIVTGSWDKTAKIWDAKTYAEILTLGGHRGSVYSASFSSDGSRIVTGSDDKTAKLWDANTGAELFTLSGHEGRVNSASFSPDGLRIVTGSNDKTAKVWDAKSGVEILTIKGHGGTACSASFSPDGSQILTGGLDGTAEVWDANTGTLVLMFRDQGHVIRDASFSPDGLRVLTTNSDKSAKVWDATNGEEILTLRGEGGNFTSASFSSDGTRVVAGNWEGPAKVWDAEPGMEVFTISGEDRGFQLASINPDGSLIATGIINKTAKVWDAKTGVELVMLEGDANYISRVSFTPRGSRVLTGSEDKTAKVWDVKTGKAVARLSGHGNTVRSASFSPDGSRVVTEDMDVIPKVWNADTGEEVVSLRGHTDSIESVSFSPDGSRVLTGSLDGTAKVWDVKTGAIILTLTGHANYINSAIFNHDGTRIVTSSGDKTAKLWDTKNGAIILTLMGHQGEITSASFSPDGMRVVTGSRDDTVKLWDAKTGAEVLSLRGLEGVNHSASFSPDGSRVVTESTKSIFDSLPFLDLLTVKIWDATPIKRGLLTNKLPK